MSIHVHICEHTYMHVCIYIYFLFHTPHPHTAPWKFLGQALDLYL